MVVLLAVTGCKKETGPLGFGIQPDSDKINVQFNDTASIVAYSTLIDSISSGNTPASLAGSLFDPVFGSSTASFSTSFRLSRTSFSFGENARVDSLVLSLDYARLFGDSTAPVTLRFYELTEKLTADTVYSSKSQVAWSDVLLAEITFVPNTLDSLVVGGDTVAPHLRVNMTSHSQALAEKLVSASDEEMSNNTAFQDFFHGLRVEAVPVTSSGQIIAFNLTSSMSEMSLYYQNDEADSLRYDYLLNSNSVRFGNFSHDYTLGDSRFKAQVLEGDTTLGAEINYIQPLGGVTTRIFFPHITRWADSGPVVVNEARIFLEGYEENPYLDPPLSIVLVRFTEEDLQLVLLEQLEGTDYFGGVYDEENNRYWFRITSYIQELMNGSIEDHGLGVVVNGAAYTASRFVMTGPDPDPSVAPEKRMRLELKYTTLDNGTGP